MRPAAVHQGLNNTEREEKWSVAIMDWLKSTFKTYGGLPVDQARDLDRDQNTRHIWVYVHFNSTSIALLVIAVHFIP